jgi:hypothetical protein
VDLNVWYNRLLKQILLVWLSNSSALQNLTNSNGKKRLRNTFEFIFAYPLVIL